MNQRGLQMQPLLYFILWTFVKFPTKNSLLVSLRSSFKAI
jgi:hypothetical protein